MRLKVSKLCWSANSCALACQSTLVPFDLFFVSGEAIRMALMALLCVCVCVWWLTALDVVYLHHINVQLVLLNFYIWALVATSIVKFVDIILRLTVDIREFEFISFFCSKFEWWVMRWVLTYEVNCWFFCFKTSLEKFSSFTIKHDVEPNSYSEVWTWRINLLLTFIWSSHSIYAKKR
jgi:hypothetical protein